MTEIRGTNTREQTDANCKNYIENSAREEKWDFNATQGEKEC